MRRRHESTLAAALHRSNVPSRGLRQPARDVRAPTCRRGTATGECAPGCSASTRCSRTTSGRRSAPPREARVRAVRRVDLRVARAARRGVRRAPCAAAAARSAGSTSTRTRGRWAARSPRARRAPSVHRDELRRHGAVSLGTLAHELGHSMHSYLTWETQPPISSRLLPVRRGGRVELPPGAAARPSARDGRGSRAAARRARRGDRELPPLLLRHAHARTLRARGARARRAGRGADRRSSDERMADLFAEAYGPDFTVDRERVGITWAQFPHLYAPFYVYPVRNRHLGRARTRAQRARRGAPARPSATSTSSGPAAPRTRSTSCGRRASTSRRPSPSRRRSRCSRRSSIVSSDVADPG